MVTKVDRDVLYSDDTRQCNIYTLQENHEAPLHRIIYRNRGCPYILFARGSLTVEAAFCGTIFFLALFSLLYLFQVMERYNGVQMQLASAVHAYECYGTKRRLLQDEQKNFFVVGWEEDRGICYVRHRDSIPYLGGNFFQVSWYQQMKVSSYRGRSMISQGREQGKYVYLAEHGKVYHRNRECVYLKPGIQEIMYEQVKNKRNISGGKYDRCKSCGKHSQPEDGMLVYITPYGDSWHLQKSCPGLKRGVRKVLIEEVGGLPPCSKCGGG